MTWKRAVLAACLLALGIFPARSARAQSPPPLGGIVTAVPRPSAYPADWQSTPTLATMLIVNSGPPATCMSEVFLSSSKGDGVSAPLGLYVPTGQTNYYTSAVTTWKMTFHGKLKEGFDRTGRLPDGTYLLTVHCFNVTSTAGGSLPDFFATTSFTISVPQPPSLLYPANESVVGTPNPVFQWMPSLRASGDQPAYRFRLVEMLPGQTPLRAIEGNVPLAETTIQNTTALTYPPYVPQLVSGRRYAWRVQSIEPPNPQLPSDVIFPVGTNEGKSQVFTFTWRSRGPSAAGETPRVGEGSGSPTGDEGRRSDALPPSPGFGGLKNFADRLVHAMASRWKMAASFTNAAPPRGSASLPASPAPAAPVAPVAPDSVATEVTVPMDSTATAPPPAPAAAAAAPAGFGPQWLKLHGTTSFAQETYSRDGGTPTRPFRSGRVTSGLSVGLANDRMKVPVSALVSGDQVSFRENINQIAVHPQFTWNGVQTGVQAGHFSPQYATYTLADATVLGGGLELTPGRWRIGLLDGKSRKAIAVDPAVAIQPQFARNVIAGRVGYGDPLTNTMEVSVMRAKDDRNSLSDSTLEVTAESNTVYGVKAQGVLPRYHLRGQVESALSRFDRDQRADNPNLNGTAVALRLFRETVLTSVGASFEELGGGFMSLGNSGITNDRRDIGFTGRAQLPSGKLSLNLNAGWRNDNVSEVMLAGTARRNYSVNAAWLPIPTFGTDFQFGFTTCDVDSSPSVSSSGNITRLVSVSPHLTYVAGGIQQGLSASASLQSSSNTTSAPVQLGSTHGLTLAATWSASITPLLALTFGGNYNKTDLDVAVTEISAFGPGFVWTHPGARLATSAQLDFTRSRTGNLGTDTEFAPRCEMRWQTSPHHALVFRGNFRRYRFAAGAPEFNERLASLEYAVTL